MTQAATMLARGSGAGNIPAAAARWPRPLGNTTSITPHCCIGEADLALIGDALDMALRTIRS
jgi:hypothetical protein